MLPRMTKKKPSTTQEAPRKQSFLRPSSSKKVIHDTQSGWIYTDLGKDYGTVRMTEDDHALFLKDYSRHYGPALDQDQMANRWGFPSPHAVAEYVRIHGIRHTSLPFTDSELETKGVHAAVDEAVIRNRQNYLETYQKRAQQQLRTDAAKYNMLEEALLDVVGELKLSPQQAQPLHLRPASKPFLALFGLSDSHYGALTFDADGNVNYDPGIAEKTVLEVTDNLIARITVQGKPEAIYMMVGTDSLHIDTPTKTTTKGTPLAVSTAGENFATLIAGYVDLQVAVIERLLAVGCPLTLIITPGNHDYAVSVMLGVLLKKIYSSHPLVRFVDQPHEPVQFDTLGEVTLAFNHGEQVKEKTMHREFLTAHNKRGVKLGKALVMVSGHLHHLRIQDCDGVDWIQWPSPKPADEWHKSSGYAHSRAGAAAVTYTLDGQLQDTHHVRL